MQHVRLGVFVATAALVTAAAVAASGQIELAVITGTVVDEAGEPLEGVTVRIRDVERGRETVIVSGGNGRFYRRGLRAVEYDIAVELDGYQPVYDKVRLNAGTDRRLSFTLARSAPDGAAEFSQGVEAFNRNDYQAAAEAFEATVEKAPDLPEARVNLALAYRRLSRVADAVTQLEKAASLAPDQASVLFQLGGTYVEMNDLDKAAAALEKGLAAQPDLTDALAYEATATLGAVYFAQGRNDAAVARFERALAERPEATTAKLGLGKALFSRGDHARALVLFREVITMAPDTPEAAETEAFIEALEKTTQGGRLSVGIVRASYDSCNNAKRTGARSIF